MQVVIATGNPHKASEISAILSPLLPRDWRLTALEGAIGEPDETGATFLENALIKARHYCAATGLPAVSDDSGLCVDALDGAPGIHSSRYAGTDDARIAKLLCALNAAGARDPEQRRARFVSCAAVAFPDGRTIDAEGALEGRIASRPQGVDGFGYDPIFYLPERGLTVAQLSASRKNDVSHRSKALRALAVKLILAGEEPDSSNF